MGRRRRGHCELRARPWPARLVLGPRLEGASPAGRLGALRLCITGAPCETFSRARAGPPGLRPLRGSEHLYGLPKDRLSPEGYEQVRLGTYFALQSIQLATAC
eukprot:3596925-Alexandrium_andersonii.AAC.1